MISQWPWFESHHTQLSIMKEDEDDSQCHPTSKAPGLNMSSGHLVLKPYQFLYCLLRRIRHFTTDGYSMEQSSTKSHSCMFKMYNYVLRIISKKCTQILLIRGLNTIFSMESF